MNLGDFTTADWVGIGAFILAWLGYSALVDHGPFRARTLSSSMDRQRRAWVEMMQSHEIRIADTNILSGLQQGTAFFASASMLAIGAALAVLGSGERVAEVLNDIAPAATPTGELFEAKMIGLAVIFVYAFFKFGWGYRLFNYASILVGSLPPATQSGTPEAKAAIERATVFLRLGGRNFNRGQRAFHFSLAYLGWLAGPWALVVASAFVLGVLTYRQFWSESARAVQNAALPSTGETSGNSTP